MLDRLTQVIRTKAARYITSKHKAVGNRLAQRASKKYLVEVSEDLGFYRTPIGDYYLPIDAPKDVIIKSMQRGKLFEREIIEVASRFVTKGTTVLDIGSNFGQMAIAFSELTGNGGHVYAFEADDFVYDVLNRNLKANGCSNVTTTLGAVYNENGKEFFFPQQDFRRFGSYGSYGIDLHARKGRTVPSLTIDSLEIGTPISFMKVDVQGSDLFALRGAVNTIKAHQMPIVFEFEQQFQIEFGTSFQDYADFVREIDYVFEEVILGINYLILPRNPAA